MGFHEARFILLISLSLLFLSLCAVVYIHSSDSPYGARAGQQSRSGKRLDIQIQGYTPKESDHYVVISMKAEPSYITKFEPLASVERVHHMLLYGCERPAYEGLDQWDGGETCSGNAYLIWQWARSGDPFVLPADVGFSVGNRGDRIRYLVLQIHYVRPFVGRIHDYSGVSVYLADKPPKYVASVYMFVSYPPIPARRPAFFSNVSCTYDYDTELHPFAFRVHTHPLGKMVSAYVRHSSSGKWSKVGKRNPQWPQDFQAAPRGVVVRKGDLLAGTCRYDTHDRNVTVPVGAMGADEMCVFYIIFYRDANSAEPFDNSGFGAGCYAHSHYTPPLALEYPTEGLALPPSHPEWVAIGRQAKRPFGVVERAGVGKLYAIGGQPLGSVTGLAFDPAGNVVVFHRAERKWKLDGIEFDASNALLDKSPINAAVVLVVSQTDHRLVAKYGRKMFHLPQGIFVDGDGSYFTTDAGSHQLTKWTIKNGELSRVWDFGEKFVPGSDKSHLCKPSAVTVSALDGAVFIADGHCNNRVLKLTRHGAYTVQWIMAARSSLQNGASLSYSSPYDVTIDDANRRLYVADRVNGHVLIRSLESGSPLGEIHHPKHYSRVHSVHSSTEHGIFFLGGRVAGGNETIEAYVLPPRSPTIQYSFQPPSGAFKRAHTIRTHNEDIWVGELAADDKLGGGGGGLWHLRMETEGLSGPRDLIDYSVLEDTMVELPTVFFLYWVLFFALVIAVGCAGARRCCKSSLQAGAVVIKSSGKSRASPIERMSSTPLKSTKFGISSSSDEEGNS